MTTGIISEGETYISLPLLDFGSEIARLSVVMLSDKLQISLSNCSKNTNNAKAANYNSLAFGNGKFDLLGSAKCRLATTSHRLGCRGVVWKINVKVSDLHLN